MNAATAISAYSERISGIELRIDALSNEMDRRFDAMLNEMDRRFDAVDDRFAAQAADVNRRFIDVDERMVRIEDKLDKRFGWQTVMMAVLGVLTLFGDPIRGLLGI